MNTYDVFDVFEFYGTVRKPARDDKGIFRENENFEKDEKDEKDEEEVLN